MIELKSVEGIVLHFIDLSFNLLYNIVLYCLYRIVSYCIVLYCIVLYCIVLYCIVLYEVALTWIKLYRHQLNGFSIYRSLHCQRCYGLHLGKSN